MKPGAVAGGARGGDVSQRSQNRTLSTVLCQMWEQQAVGSQVSNSSGVGKVMERTWEVDGEGRG